jgi:hypothetical protein
MTLFSRNYMLMLSENDRHTTAAKSDFQDNERAAYYETNLQGFLARINRMVLYRLFPIVINLASFLPLCTYNLDDIAVL